jgi:GAF domain-containing protein
VGRDAKRLTITFYEPARLPHNERAREIAVEASGILSRMDDPELNALVAEARQVFGTAQAAVSVVYQDSHFLIAASGLPAGPYSRKSSLSGHVIHEPERLFWLPDVRDDPRFAGNPAVEGYAVAFYAAAALVDANGYALGSFFIFDPTPRGGSSEEDASRLFAFARAAMNRVEAFAA